MAPVIGSVEAFPFGLCIWVWQARLSTTASGAIMRP